MDSAILPSEVEMYIETMVPQKMKQLGTQAWFEFHKRIQKLNQEAVLEAMSLKEEHVKEALVTCNKVKVLIHEAILINMWKYKVLPYLLKFDPNPTSTFIAYSILYHEGVCVSLLEIVMYHANCCEALEDSVVDLLDYVSGTASQLLTVKHREAKTTETGEKELFRQRNNLAFDIGIRSLSIIRYISENIERLPISVYSKIYSTHDIIVLFIEILMLRPWKRSDGKIYSNNKWIVWESEKLPQIEAQIWLTIRYLMLDPECSRYYTLTKGRKAQLVKLIPIMTPVLLDQISPLIELKQLLSRIAYMETSDNSAASKPLLLEPVLEIKQNILNQCHGGTWKKIAGKQLATIFTSDQKVLKEVASTLSEAYNDELMEILESSEKEMKENCAQCDNKASQRCSRCRKMWYCSRSCQVAHWPQHKEECLAY